MSDPRCPICGEAFGSQSAIAIHHGMRHAPKRCRYRGDNRGWCVAHDAEWRIDRARCDSALAKWEASK